MLDSSASIESPPARSVASRRDAMHPGDRCDRESKRDGGSRRERGRGEVAGVQCRVSIFTG